jgi:hypothetical protein
MAGGFSLSLEVLFYTFFDPKFFGCKLVKICFEKAALDPDHVPD